MSEKRTLNDPNEFRLKLDKKLKKEDPIESFFGNMLELDGFISFTHDERLLEPVL